MKKSVKFQNNVKKLGLNKLGESWILTLSRAMSTHGMSYIAVIDLYQIHVNLVISQLTREFLESLFK